MEHATRLFRYWFTPLLSHEDAGFYEEGLLFTDAQFFDVFSFPFVRGTPEEALTAPFSLVLTESAARKYFGDTDPLGQTLVLNAEHEMTVRPSSPTRHARRTSPSPCWARSMPWTM